MNKSYMLEGRDSELKNHVGHKVEVTGTLDSSTGSSSGSTSSSAGTTGTTSGTSSGTAGAGTSTGSSSAMNGIGQHLRVTSVRMISADCSK